MTSCHCLTLLSNFQLHSEERERERENPYSARKDLCDASPSSLFTFIWCHPSLLHTLITTSIFFPVLEILKLSPVLEFLHKGHPLPTALFFTAWPALGLSGLAFNVSTEFSILRIIHDLWPVP